MSVNPYPTQKDIVDFLRAQMPDYEIFRGEVPTAETLKRVQGQLKAYCVIRFSSPGREYRGNSFAGARGDNFYAFCDVLCVAKDNDKAGQVAGLVFDTLIGYKPVNANSMNARPATGQFSVLDSADKPQAAIDIASFRYNYNFSDVTS